MPIMTEFSWLPTDFTAYRCLRLSNGAADSGTNVLTRERAATRKGRGQPIIGRALRSREKPHIRGSGRQKSH